jgi:hypothetical protein
VETKNTEQTMATISLARRALQFICSVLGKKSEILITSVLHQREQKQIGGGEPDAESSVLSIDDADHGHLNTVNSMQIALPGFENEVF